MNVTEYLHNEYEGAEVLYKSLSKIRTLSSDRKREVLDLIEKQLDLIDTLEPETGTPAEERKVAFINRTLIAARRIASSKIEAATRIAI